MGIEVQFIILIIAVPIYFLSRWIMKRLRLGNADNRKFIAIIPAVILSPFLYIALIMAWIAVISYHPTEKFSKEKWDANIEKRYTMSKDIIESNMLVGKTKEEIILLLGDEYYEYNEKHIAYYLGFTPALFNIDPSVLNIYFEEGRAVKVEQHEI